jgi:HEAT repeat protein
MMAILFTTFISMINLEVETMNNENNLSGYHEKDHIKDLLRKLLHGKTSEDALNELRSMNKEYLIDMLKDLLRDDDLYVRDGALRIMMDIDPTRGVDIIIPLLNDPMPEWRWYICGALADYGDARAVVPLTQVLLSDTDSDTRYMATLALEKIGNHLAIPALQHAQQFDQGTDYEGRRIDTLAAEAIQAILERGAK